MTDLFDVLQETWPPASVAQIGPWQIYEGQGGGQRVSAARQVSDFDVADIGAAETEMQDIGQHPLFMIRPGNDRLDGALAAQGYSISDPTLLMTAPLELFLDRKVPPVTTFPIWPPLQIMYDLWSETGMDSARFAIMDRVTGPKTSILGRVNARPAGTVFAAIAGRTVMVHALEIEPAHRRQGLARHLMHACTHWGAKNDASDIALAVVRDNVPAIALYRSLGMEDAGGYHYRKAP